MLRSFVNSGKQSDWEAEIKAALQELKLHGHEMSPYEKNVISREIKRRQDELIPVVGARVIGEFHAAIKGYKKAEELQQAERAKEINRFDSGKLNAEMQLIQARVNNAMSQITNNLRGDSVAARLQNIYAEAVQSGDIHKQRAAVEVMKSVSVGGPERLQVNQLARDAEAAELQFRQTEGTRSAQQARIDSLGELHAKHENLNRVSQLLGMGPVDVVFSDNPFSRAARMVEFTPEGPQIHEADAPQVTGVYWKQQEAQHATN